MRSPPPGRRHCLCRYYVRCVANYALYLCFTDGCRPLCFRVPCGWLTSARFQSASRMVAVRLVESCTNSGLLSPWRGGRHKQGEPGARPGRGRAHEGEVRTSLPSPPPPRVTARRRGFVDSAARASAVPAEDGLTHASRAGGPRTRTRTRTRTRGRVASARKRGARVRAPACA